MHIKQTRSSQEPPPKSYIFRYKIEASKTCLRCLFYHWNIIFLQVTFKYIKIYKSQLLLFCFLFLRKFSIHLPTFGKFGIGRFPGSFRKKTGNVISYSAPYSRLDNHVFCWKSSHAFYWSRSSWSWSWLHGSSYIDLCGRNMVTKE